MPSVPGPYAVIHSFEVSADHSGRGYGRQAIELLATLGWERHEHEIDTASRPGMSASRLQPKPVDCPQQRSRSMRGSSVKGWQQAKACT